MTNVSMFSRSCNAHGVLFLLATFALQRATQGCGGVFTAPTGQLTSPGYPGVYPSDQECVYVIQRPEGDSVTLNFHDLDLQHSEHCTADTLVIRDGNSGKAPLRVKVCGTEMPTSPIKSFSSAFWVQFTSDHVYTAGGFKITYTAGPDPNSPFLLFSAPTTIDIRHYREGGSMSLPIPGIYNPVGLEFDPRDRRLYWSDGGIGEIRSALLNGTDWRSEYTHQDDDFSMALALDPVNRLLFFNNHNQRTVVMRSLLSGHQKTVAVSVFEVVSLALDHLEGLLFVMDMAPSISRSLYDGTDRRNIVTRHLLGPSCLAVDRVQKRLYWVDALYQKVEWSDYEGKGRSSQAASFTGTYFFALAVTPTHLYLVDWGREGIKSKYSIVRQMEKDGSNDSAVLVTHGRLKDVLFYDGSTFSQEASGCVGQGAGGTCSHLCIPLGGQGQGQVRCVCPDRFLLSADQKTCKPRTGMHQNSPFHHSSDEDLEDDDDDDEDDDDEDDEDDEDDDDLLHTVQKVLQKTKAPSHAKKDEQQQSGKLKMDRGKTQAPTVVISEVDYLKRPITAHVSLTGPRPFETDGSKVMPVTCQYDGEGIRRWTGDCVELKDKVCVLRPRVPSDDGKTIMCQVYFLDGSYGYSVFTLQLNYPPQSPPLIKGYNSGQVLKTGDKLRMTCVVQGGKPLVSAVDFSCSGHPDTEPDEESRTYVQASVTIKRLASSDDGVRCVCSAEWKVPEMYTKKAYVTLRVTSRGKTEL